MDLEPLLSVCFSPLLERHSSARTTDLATIITDFREVLSYCWLVVGCWRVGTGLEEYRQSELKKQQQYQKQ